MQNVNDINTVNDDNISVIIGKNIVTLLNRDKLSVSAACDMSKERHLNIARQTLSKAIKGDTELTITQLLDICRFFGVSLDYLMGKTPYTNPDARAAGEYIGLCPESVEMLHANKYHTALVFLDYFIRQQGQDIFNLLHQIGAAAMLHSECKLFDTLSGSEELNAENIDNFISIFAKCDPSADKEQATKLQRITIEDTIRDIIEKVEPVHLLYWQWQKAYWQQNNGAFNDAEYEITPEMYKQGLADYEKIYKAYKAATDKKKRRKRQQDFEKFQ